MITAQIVAAVAAAVLMTGFAANEMTHGGVAEGMGLGHQHMLDAGGYHCAGPDDAHWQQHTEHMHGNGTAHDHCGSGHMAQGHMDGGMQGGMHA